MRTFPAYGWLGLLGLAVSELLLLRGNAFVATWFTPIMWTGYILAADAVVHLLRGRSWLTSRRREVPLVALLSVGVWVLFEAYNFHLRNWYYVNVPTQPLARTLGYFWSFATIMPGIFETADLAETILYRRAGTKDGGGGRLGPSWLWFLMGVAMVTVPLAVPPSIAAYLFAFVWLGFIFLLDPVNEAMGAPSLRRLWATGRQPQVVSLLIGGFLCGLLWEAWNYQALIHAGAHWVYTVPGPLRVMGLHYGQMPVLGLGGFPPFALEVFAFYHFLKCMLGGQKVFGPAEA